MRFNDIFKISVQNIKCNRLLYLKISSIIFICVFLMCLMLTYCITLQMNMINLKKQKMSLCQNIVIASEDEAKRLSSESSEYTITSELSLQMLLNGVQKKTYEHLYLNSSALEYNNTLYYGVNDFTYDFSVNGKLSKNELAVPFRIDALKPGSVLMAKAELKEYYQKFEKKSWLIGKLPENENEFVISDYLLKKYGFSESEQNKLIDETFSIYAVINETKICILKNYKLCGIIDSDIFYIHGKNNCAQIYVADTPIMQKYHKSMYIIRMFEDSFRGATMRHNDLVKLGYSVQENATLYLFTAIDTQQLLIGNFLIIVCSTVLISMSITLISILQNYVYKRSGYFHMLQCMGMRRYHVMVLFFVELIIITLPLTILGIVLSQHISNTLVSNVAKLSGEIIIINPYYQTISIGITSICLFIWLYICSMYEVSIIQKKR